jgi:hypothetical protein
MARDASRPVTGPIGSDPTMFASLLLFRDRQTGRYKARFSSYLTLKAAKADLTARGHREMPFCLTRLHNRPHLVELLQKTSGVIIREIGEMEDLIADVFFFAVQLGADRERKRLDGIVVMIEDDSEGDGK